MNHSTTRTTVADIRPTHELLWTESGVSSATLGASTWIIIPALGLWVPAGMPRSTWTPTGTRLLSAVLDIDEVPAFAEGPLAIDIDPLLSLLLRRLVSEELAESSRSLTERMVADVLRPAARELVLRVPASALLQPIVDAVQGQRDYELTLSEWADRLGVSSRTITRAFHAETGVGFSRWSATVRAQHSIELLAAGQLIDDVADAVGFRSSSAFGTSFRGITGMTPGRFQGL